MGRSAPARWLVIGISGESPGLLRPLRKDANPNLWLIWGWPEPIDLLELGAASSIGAL